MMCNVSSNLRKENIDETLVLILDFIHRIGHKFSQADLLTCLDFVMWKGLETSIDMQRLRSGLILNNHTRLFQLLTILYLQKMMTNIRKTFITRTTIQNTKIIQT